MSSDVPIFTTQSTHIKKYNKYTQNQYYFKIIDPGQGLDLGSPTTDHHNHQKRFGCANTVNENVVGLQNVRHV